jgi:hypothetical protein
MILAQDFKNLKNQDNSKIIMLMTALLNNLNKTLTKPKIILNGSLAYQNKAKTKSYPQK